MHPTLSPHGCALRRLALAAVALAALTTLPGCSSAEPALEPTAPDPDMASTRPTALGLHAWQIEDRVLVVARGENPTGGYDTALVPTGGPGQLRLRNVPPEGPAIQMISPFELSAWIEADGPLSRVTVHVADESEQVPVVQAPRLRERD